MRKASAFAAGLAALTLVASAAAQPVPPDRAARQAQRIAVVGQEGTSSCLLTYLECTTGDQVEAVAIPVLRSAYVQTPSWRFVPDLVVSSSATKTTLSYRIRDDAYWYWGGRKLPVTYRDFVYTWRMIADPKHVISYADRPTYVGITGYTHNGPKQITFHWTKPIGNWQKLFSPILPSAAVAGMRFATMWKNCICGRDGKPVADGPFFLARHEHGTSVLKPNPYWYGRQPRLAEIVFRPLPTRAAEIAAVRNGTVDIVNPTSSFTPAFAYGPWLKALLHVPGTVFEQVPGGLAEHIDMQFGPKGQPLLSARWFRQAIALGIDRNAVIAKAFGPLAAGVRRLDSLMYSSTDILYRPDFARWSYNPKAALALLKQHCTGGPEVPGPTTSVWTCSGVAANVRFLYEKPNPIRAAAFRVMHDELARIGVVLGDNGVATADLFGSHGVPSSDYDLAEFAWGAFDPSDFARPWSCSNALNYLNYCNHEVTRLFQSATKTLDPDARTRMFVHADALLAADVPSIPLYDKPWPLVRAARLGGVANNALQNFDWNIEDWYWEP